MRIISELDVENLGILGTRSFTFLPGFNIIRGANEAGKSTVLEAIGIGFFGSSAMRGTWEDLVTEGKKVGQLKIRMKFGEFTVLRSKSSASIVSDDGRVEKSGHNEVNEFFLKLFGIERGTEKHVMVAKQGKIQGILESGDADATKFIEDLAGFSKIDALVDRVKLKYPVTDRQALEQQLLSLEEKLVAKHSEELPDLVLSAGMVQLATNDHDKVKGLVDSMQKLLDSQRDLLTSLVKKQTGHEKAKDHVVVCEKQVSGLCESQESLVKAIQLIEAEADASQGRLNSALKTLADIQENQKRLDAYNKVKTSPLCMFTWDEDLDALHQAIESNQVIASERSTSLQLLSDEVIRLTSSSLVNEHILKLKAERDELSKDKAVLAAMSLDNEDTKALEDRIAKLDSDIAVANARFVTEEGVCSSCGTDLTAKADDINTKVAEIVSSLEVARQDVSRELKEKRLDLKTARSAQEKELDREYFVRIKKIDEVTLALSKARDLKISEMTEEIASVKEQLKSTQEDLEALIEIKTTQEKVVGLIQELVGNKVSIDKSVYPWSINWSLDIPKAINQQQIDNANNDVVYCRGLVTQLKGKQEEYDKVCEALATAQASLSAAKLALSDSKDVSEDILEKEKEVEDCKANLDDLRNMLQESTTELNNATTQLKLNEQIVAEHSKGVAEVKADVEAVNAKLLKSAENNALLRAVSAARSTVVENVWNTLFSATKTCFSLIRGVESNIVRDGKFFRVNGIKTVRLSGSTLDSLGLAMRGAIRDVFTPTSDVMLLDELAAGMDEDRTAAAMSQVSALSVAQKILVTHENISDGLADNIVEV
jgi:DNA repair exonuclease SbcCD ATPase subunit